LSIHGLRCQVAGVSASRSIVDAATKRGLGGSACRPNAGKKKLRNLLPISAIAPSRVGNGRCLQEDNIIRMARSDSVEEWRKKKGTIFRANVVRVAGTLPKVAMRGPGANSSIHGLRCQLPGVSASRRRVDAATMRGPGGSACRPNAGKKKLRNMVFFLRYYPPQELGMGGLTNRTISSEWPAPTALRSGEKKKEQFSGQMSSV
jgi:hypothetical protein